MNRAERQSLLAIPIILVLAAAVAWAGSQGGSSFGGLPLFMWCGLVAFGLNWAVFIPSYLQQTERFFDLTGSITYVTLVMIALALHPAPDARGLLIGGLVTLWALRLGTFLFRRISRDGSDGRFDALKPSLPRFFLTWTLQGLWVLLTLSCGLAAMTSTASKPFDLMAALGTVVWVAGFGIEILADRQKQVFRSDASNREKFIQSGLWAWSRHPNYAGEILLWTGIALIAFPALRGWQYWTLVSPLFVYVLLTRISGIPLLEARAERRWGDAAAYKLYVKRTPVLFPRLRRFWA